jgi:hypothetical protein
MYDSENIIDRFQTQLEEVRIPRKLNKKSTQIVSEKMHAILLNMLNTLPAFYGSNKNLRPLIEIYIAACKRKLGDDFQPKMEGVNFNNLIHDFLYETSWKDDGASDADKLYFKEIMASLTKAGITKLDIFSISIKKQDWKLLLDHLYDSSITEFSFGYILFTDNDKYEKGNTIVPPTLPPTQMLAEHIGFTNITKLIYRSIGSDFDILKILFSGLPDSSVTTIEFHNLMDCPKEKIEELFRELANTQVTTIIFQDSSYLVETSAIALAKGLRGTNVINIEVLDSSGEKKETPPQLRKVSTDNANRIQTPSSANNKAVTQLLKGLNKQLDEANKLIAKLRQDIDELKKRKEREEAVSPEEPAANGALAKIFSEINKLRESVHAPHYYYGQQIHAQQKKIQALEKQLTALIKGQEEAAQAIIQLQLDGKNLQDQQTQEIATAIEIVRTEIAQARTDVITDLETKISAISKEIDAKFNDGKNNQAITSLRTELSEKIKLATDILDVSINENHHRIFQLSQCVNSNTANLVGTRQDVNRINNVLAPQAQVDEAEKQLIRASTNNNAEAFRKTLHRYLYQSLYGHHLALAGIANQASLAWDIGEPTSLLDIKKNVAEAANGGMNLGQAVVEEVPGVAIVTKAALGIHNKIKLKTQQEKAKIVTEGIPTLEGMNDTARRLAVTLTRYYLNFLNNIPDEIKTKKFFGKLRKTKKNTLAIKLALNIAEKMMDAVLKADYSVDSNNIESTMLRGVNFTAEERKEWGNYADGKPPLRNITDDAIRLHIEELEAISKARQEQAKLAHSFSSSSAFTQSPPNFSAVINSAANAAASTPPPQSLAPAAVPMKNQGKNRGK